MNTITIHEPEHGEELSIGQAVLRKASVIEVTCVGEYTSASEFVAELKGGINRVNNRFEESCAAAFAAHRSITKLRNDCRAPFERACGIVETKLLDYRRDEERKRRDEENRLAVIARQQAENERLAQAQRYEEQGDRETATALLDAPIVVAPTVIPTAVPKIKGQHTRKTWKHRVVNEAIVPRDFLCIDETKLRKYATAMGSAGKVAGVEFYEDESIVTKAGF